VTGGTFVRAAGLASAALALFLTPGSGGAQGWAADAAVGRYTQPSLPGGVGSTGAALGVRYEGDRWLYATAGLPFDTAGATWGAAGAGARFSRPWRGLTLGIDADAQGFGYHDPIADQTGSGITLEAMPLAGIGVGQVALELRSGVQHYTASFGGQTLSRTLHASDLRASVGDDRLRGTAEGRFVRAPEADYPYLGGGVEGTHGRASFSAFAGAWLHDSIDSPVWGGTARWRVLPRTELYAQVQQETDDPLYRNAPRRSWSLGVTRRFGRPPPPAAAPPGPQRTPAGVTFRLPASASSAAPAVGGDFNGWRPAPMRREGDDWVLTLPLASGVYRYAYRGADGAWFVPEGTEGRADDGFGGVNAVLIVP
jgi:hypothetical protein